MEKIVFPKKMEVVKQDKTYGRIAIHPFERGFAHTVGNSLRRILLSSLEGAAVTEVRIAGVAHEFSTIRGVKEDVIYILMNIKKMRFKMFADEPETITLKVKGPRVVTAGDFKTSSELEIVNPDLPIATLDANATLELEAVVARGRGYHFAEDNKRPGNPVGTLYIDSIFSPVIKANYEVEATRVGQKTDYDKLIMEIWTDGTLTAEDALAYAAKVLKDTLAIFTSSSEEAEEKDSREHAGATEAEHVKQLLSQPVDILELATRASNCLKDAKITTIRELVSHTEEELKTIRNLGEKSLEEIKEKLKAQNLVLGMKA